jgi:hypothetical protein
MYSLENVPFKNKFYILLVLTFLIACGTKNDTNLTNNKKDENDSLWGPIDYKTWYVTRALNNRIAKEKDVKNGIAVFYIINESKKHSPYKVELPRLAYLRQDTIKKEELVVVIQIESTPKDTLAGYRYLKGGNGICKLNELRFVE